jgi:hypothetical protein
MLRQRRLVDDLAAGRVHQDGVRLHQLQPAGREQVIGGRRVRAVDRDDVHPREHLVEAFPIGRIELFLGDAGVDPACGCDSAPHAEGLGAARDGLADAAHADDAQALAPQAAAQHPGRRPAGPFVVGDDRAPSTDAPRPP